MRSKQTSEKVGFKCLTYTLHTKLQKFSLKKSLRKSLPIYKTVEKIVAVVKKVVVCMEDNCIFCSFVCRV